MLSNRPYLLRAFHQWIVDSGCTPVLVLDATNPRCKIPKDHAEGGEIVFNVSSAAVRDFKITNELVEFKASFSGVIHLISGPVQAVLAIYAEENGEGLFLEGEDDHGGVTTAAASMEPNNDSTVAKQTPGSSDSTNKSKPFLKLVE